MQLVALAFPVALSLQVAPSRDAVEFKVNPEKAREWAQSISEAIASGCLKAGAASKLAGRLAFATGCAFRQAVDLP